ncbi:MAG: SCO family protein [Bdellovibrionales bacterium]|nr:SCO family protein [Bdellovibrionales bacterium]
MTTTTLPGYFREDNLFQRLIRKKSVWLIFWILSFSYPVYRTLTRTLPPPLPVYYQVPEFTLTNEFGKPFGSKELMGKFYIANFMFTSCPTTCPALMNKMDLVQKRIRGLGTKAAIVTFTVDPEVDTPETLYKYARKRHSNPFIWNYLTGSQADLEKIVISGYKVPMGKKESIEKQLDTEKVTLFDIAHSEKLVLVDDKGQIRGYYGTERVEMDKMMIDLGLLVNNSFSRAQPALPSERSN